MKKIKPTWKKTVMFFVVISAIYIVATDVGRSQEQISGAGDIWWTGVPQIHQAYDKLTGPNQQ
jgi:hypothetical protein